MIENTGNKNSPPTSDPAAVAADWSLLEPALLHHSAHLRWYHIEDPDGPMLDTVARLFGFHELEVEDCRHTGQRTKLDEYDDHLFVVAIRIDFNPQTLEVSFGELHIFAGMDYIVTVHRGPSPSVGAALPRVKADSKMQRPDRVLHALLDFVVDGYPRVGTKVEEFVDDFEYQVYGSPDSLDLVQILNSKRALVELRRSAEGMREAVSSLMRLPPPYYRTDMAVYWRDLYDHILRDLSLIEGYRDMLNGVLDAHMGLTTKRTNEIMKVLALYATIALPLVVITGYFGMNFEHLPFKNLPHGVAIVHVLMLGLAAGLLIYFRRKKWM